MTATLSDIIKPSSYGCWIDAGHRSALELDSEIIFFAHGFGYDTNMTQIQDDLISYDDMTYEEQADVLQAMWEESALALDWLNNETSKIDARYTWYIDDNCLFLDYEDEEGTEFNV